MTVGRIVDSVHHTADLHAEAIEQIRLAAAALASARVAKDTAGVATATSGLERAVTRARDVNVSWQSIGDALEMRRGAAYQRFRLHTR